MDSLLKHTGIALAIIIPLAVYTVYAAEPEISLPVLASSAYDSQVAASTGDIGIKHNTGQSSITSSAQAVSVTEVDLERYAGTWYEIGRLPMYFQRRCASDVTATYTPNRDAEGQITSVAVLNQCLDGSGKLITADGQARAVDDSGSELKVTFLPSWIRWLPVGRSDYWVLALDSDYQHALVGTPNHKYLWLLSRSSEVSPVTYQQYLDIATAQGFDLSEFQRTTHKELP